MTPVAQRLSEEEVSEVADWYASIGLEVVGP
jgi:cytochrome c553